MRRPRSTIFSRGAQHRRAAHGERARAAVAAAGAERVAVAPQHLDALRRHAQLIAHDLRVRGLVALAHRGRAGVDRHRAVGVHADLRGVGVDRGVRAAGHLDRVGDAEATELAARARLGAALLEAGVLGDRQRQVHAAREVAAVVGEHQPGLERHRGGRDQVPAPQLDRIDAELARGDVDHALDRERRLGPAGAAIGAGGRGVGEHAGGLMVDGGRRVHAGHAADVVGAGPRAALGEIGADVEVDRHAQRQELAVAIEGQLGGGDVVAAVLVGDEPLAPVRRPLHRPPQPARRPQHQDHLGIDPAAHAEAAADLAGDHAHVALRHLERIGQQRARAVRPLDAGVQRVAPAAPVVLADGGARLHRGGGHAGDDEVDARDVGRARERLVDRLALAGLREERDVVGHLVPHGRCARTERVGVAPATAGSGS